MYHSVTMYHTSPADLVFLSDVLKCRRKARLEQVVILQEMDVDEENEKIPEAEMILA